MKVPFFELKPAYLELKEDLDKAFHRVMESGRYLFGPELEAFEAEYAAFCGTEYCVTVGSGLDALHLTLRALGIGEGDEVLVPSHTFIATWLAVSQAGAVPVPVEPDLQTFNMDPDRMKAAITRKTRAVIPVHLYGQPADMDPIRECARRHGLRVIEDNAQAQGALYKGRRTGSLGDAAAHSFYPAKNLGAFSDAGAVTTSDSFLADRLRLLRNYGSRQKYQHETQGFNSRVDELQAAFLRVRLNKLEEWNTRRRALADRYFETLRNVSGLALPSIHEQVESVYHLFVIQHPRRCALQERLAAAGVSTLIHYPVPPHLSGAYTRQGWQRGDFPIAERLAETVLSLPIGPHVTSEEVRFAAKAVGVAARSLDESLTPLHA